MTRSTSDTAADSEETRLLLRIAQRDRAAFAALFLTMAPRLKGYLMRLGESAVSAEEIAQEAMLTIWRKAALFDPNKAGAFTWIFVLARNQRIDFLRREHACVSYGIEPPDQPDEHTPTGSEAITNNLIIDWIY